VRTAGFEDMHRGLRVLLLLAMAAALVAEGPQIATQTFIWKHGNQIIGRLSVPVGPAVEVYDYREGIVTTLRYRDGSSIVLQVGGMYRVPLFQEPDYKLVSSTESDTKTVRIGRSGDGDLHWREDNYKPKKLVGGTGSSYFAAWPPNIGYSRVRAERQAEFDNTLNSFIREVDRTRSLQQDR
jgi:hypothetical protein